MRRAVLAMVLCLGALAPAIGAPPPADRGRRLFREGIGSAGAIVALLGEPPVEISGEVLRCGDCHGRGGKGTIEGGVTTSDIRWRTLAVESRAGGAVPRARPAYDAAALATAITRGIAPGGARLAPGMPRYRMSVEDLDALVQYMLRLGEEPAPGVDEREVRLGSLLPDDGGTLGAGESVRRTVEAYFDQVNGSGGIHGRRLVLRAAERLGEEGAGGPSASDRLDPDSVLGLLACLPVGSAAETALEDEVDRLELPLVGPLAQREERPEPEGPFVFHLLPDVGVQVRRLVAHAIEEGKTLALAAARDRIGTLARRAFEDEMGLHASVPAAMVPITSPDGDAGGVVEALSPSRPGAVILAGPPDRVAAVARELRRASWSPLVLTLSALAGSGMLDLGEAEARGVVLTWPAGSPAESLDAMAAGRDFLRSARVPLRHPGLQLAALSAAQVVVEGLRRSGREVTREGFILSLESLRDFPTAMGAPQSFGRASRLGAGAVTLVRPDPGSRRFVPLDGETPAPRP